MTLSSPNLSHPLYRPDIDGLRAVAVLSVVTFHAFPTLMSGGFIGVDIFFVISGFLISTIIFDNLEKGTFTFSEFYARRIKRIFPALLLVLIASYGFGWFALLADEYKHLGKHIAAGTGFVSNFVLWSESGYFDNTAETKPLLHLWSLGIEEQFYIVWPFAVWLAWKGGLNLLTLTIAGLGISFALNMTGVKQDAIATFYAPQTRFWELLTGSVLAWSGLYRKDAYERVSKTIGGRLAKTFYRDHSERDGKLLSSVLSALGLLLLACGFWGMNKSLSFPGAWAEVPIVGAGLIILAGPEAWSNQTVLSNKLVVWFGLISFPLYLWHWPLLSFARIVESGLPSRSIRFAAVILSVFLAWITYKFIERPVRLGNHRKATVSVLILLMFMVGCVGWTTYFRDGLKFRQIDNEQNSINDQFVGPLWKYTKNEICQNKYPLEGSEKYRWWFCMASSVEKPTLLLLGNSYANHFYPGIVSNQLLNHHSVLSIGTCSAAWYDESKRYNRDPKEPCFGDRWLRQQELINSIITGEKSIKYVIIGGLEEKPEPEYIGRLKRRIDFFEANGITVILFTPHVRIEYDIKGCYPRPPASPKHNCQIPIKMYDDLKKDFGVLVDSLKQTNPKVRVFDQNIIFCKNDSCNFKLPLMPAFRDEFAHFSEFASKLLFEQFVDWARLNVPEILNQ